MPGDFFQTMTQFGTIIAVVIFGIVLLAVCASGTSVGRALLPQSVTDVVSKLLPQSSIADAAASDASTFQLQVKGNARLQQVNVHRGDGMTTAWAFDEALDTPQAGTFAFTCFRHNLKTDSVLVPEQVKNRIDKALTTVLASREFYPTDTESADIWISVFGALEGEVSLETLTNSFDRPGNGEWREAVRTAMSHGGVADATKFGRGSLVLDVVDPQTTEVLWRAAAIADIVVDPNDAEKERRTSSAIAEMLRKFPPHRAR